VLEEEQPLTVLLGWNVANAVGRIEQLDNRVHLGEVALQDCEFLVMDSDLASDLGSLVAKRRKGVLVRCFCGHAARIGAAGIHFSRRLRHNTEGPQLSPAASRETRRLSVHVGPVIFRQFSDGLLDGFLRTGELPHDSALAVAP
jgi:hypothetical protein